MKKLFLTKRRKRVLLVTKPWHHYLMLLKKNFRHRKYMMRCTTLEGWKFNAIAKCYISSGKKSKVGCDIITRETWNVLLIFHSIPIIQRFNELLFCRLRERWNQNECHITNSTTCDAKSHNEWRHSSFEAEPLLQTSTSTIVSAVISCVLIIILLIIFVAFVYLYGKYNEDTLVGRHLKRLKQSYEQFGGATAKMTSLELGKKKSQAKAKAKSKPVSEFVNPHPMATNNNVITANM